jgi:hypothetical protein
MTGQPKAMRTPRKPRTHHVQANALGQPIPVDVQTLVPSAGLGIQFPASAAVIVDRAQERASGPSS